MKYMDESDDKRSENRFKKFESDEKVVAEDDGNGDGKDGGDDGEKNIRL